MSIDIILKMSSPNNPEITEDDDSRADFFGHLNDDCLSHIFTYLSWKQRIEVPLVCKRWRDAAPLVWTNVKAINFNNPLNRTIQTDDDCIRVILRKCRGSLHELQLGRCVDMNVLKVVQRYCHNLTKFEVDVSACREDRKFCTRRLLLSILQYRRLQYLKIKGWDTRLVESVFNAMPRQTLTELHVLGDGGNFKHPQIFTKFFKLTAVTLANYSFSAYTSKTISYQKQLRHLSLLELQGTCLPRLMRLTNLEHLTVSSKLVNDEFVIVLSINNKKLRYLHFGDGFHISDRGILALVELPELEELHVNFAYTVTGEHFGALSHLKKLNVRHCYKVDDSGVIELIQSAVNLQYLNLVKTSVTENALRAAADVLCDRNTRLEVIVNSGLKQFWKNYAGSFPRLIVNM